MKYKAIIFDNAGVLISESHKVWSRAIANHFDLRFSDIYKHYSRSENWPLYKHGKITETEFFQRGNILSGHKLPTKKLKEILREKRVPIKSVTNLIPKLSKNYTLAIINNEGHEWDDYSRKKESFYKHFSVLTSSYEVASSKPDKKIYKLLIKRLKKINIRPKECIYIDDRQNNLDTGKLFGFTTILYTSSKKLKKDLKELKITI